jgi:cytochrome c biogenesis protein CcmG/thiol:disulfide interchange protein DsbE
VIGAVVLLALALTVAGWQGQAPQALPLRPAPAFDLERLDRPGERLRLADFRGRPVLVNFWASWCVPCRQEMPELESVRNRYAGRLEVVGINMWDDEASANALLDEFGVTYPQGIDRDGEVVKAFGIDAVPSTAFITADGRFAAVANGKPSPSELQAMITEHLGL